MIFPYLIYWASTIQYFIFFGKSPENKDVLLAFELNFFAFTMFDNGIRKQIFTFSKLPWTYLVCWVGTSLWWDPLFDILFIDKYTKHFPYAWLKILKLGSAFRLTTFEKTWNLFLLNVKIYQNSGHVMSVTRFLDALFKAGLCLALMMKFLII